MALKDHFSERSQDYRRFRPHYQEELFSYLVSLVAQPSPTAWDCGTGNGQVAHALAKYCQKVYASDASEQQLSQAIAADNIEYVHCSAESSPLSDSSIDLITVAQAFHWFDSEKFYREVERVLKPNGIIAIWCYGFFTITNASDSLNAALKEFYLRVESFWPPERQLINTGYQTINFPFVEIGSPKFILTARWTVAHLIGYLNTWSATRNYLKTHGEKSLRDVIANIVDHWNPEDGLSEINWPLHLRVGKNLSRK